RALGTLLGQDGLHARDLAAQPADLRGVIELVGEVRKLRLPQVARQLAFHLRQVTHRPLAQFRRFHSCSLRASTLQLSGSLLLASLNALWAISLGTPSSSYNTRPGSTTATYSSTPPLPLPIRVSSGFLVSGLSGKMRMNSLPMRLVSRWIAIRAA